MKHILITITCFLTFSTISLSQSKLTKYEKVKVHIIDLETSCCDAWKNKNSEWFQTNTTEEFISINSNGISTKSEVIESIHDCDLKRVNLEDIEFVRIQDEEVIMTYIANQEGYCSKKKLTSKLRVRVNYVKHDNKWLRDLHIVLPSKD